MAAAGAAARFVSFSLCLVCGGCWCLFFIPRPHTQLQTGISSTARSQRRSRRRPPRWRTWLTATDNTVKHFCSFDKMKVRWKVLFWWAFTYSDFAARPSPGHRPHTWRVPLGSAHSIIILDPSHSSRLDTLLGQCHPQRNDLSCSDECLTSVRV